jgi:hypothetical protein
MATQKGSKMTVFSFNCWAWPCPARDHCCSKKTKTTEETATKTARVEMMTGWRRSKNYMLRVAKSRVTTVEVRKK